MNKNSPKKQGFNRNEPGMPTAILRYFFSEIKDDKKRVSFFAAAITGAHLVRYVLVPLFMSFIVQGLVSQAPVDYILTLIGCIAIVATIGTVLNDKGFTSMFEHEEDVQTRLTSRVAKYLMHHSYHFFTEQRVGTLAGDMMNFVRSYQNIMDAYFFQTSNLIIGFLASLIVIGFLSPILLLPLSAITVGMVLLNVRNLQKRAPYRNERKRRTSLLTGIIADVMGNHILTRVFAREDHEIKLIEKERAHIESLSLSEIHIIERESLYRQTMVYSFQILTLLLAVYLYISHSVSIAALVFMVTYLMRTSDSVFGISTVIRQYEQAFLDASPMMKILQMPQEVVDIPHAKTLVVKNGSIALQNVAFSYALDSSNEVFSDLTLTIPSGQRVGLAGHSGGGKSTLTKILLRFADTDHGVIEIDGQDIATITQESLRRNIAYVPQEPFLFHRSLRENIAYGKPDATEEEILKATEKAHAWEFIESLPSGLDTIVGERGVKLSGGQRQRVAIARAILKDAPILILDEATSALDSESERLIQKSLEELMKGRTSIVVAHRLSTIAKLDRIIVLENGKIAEDGSHTELLENRGIYAKLWSHQSGGFIDEQ